MYEPAEGAHLSLPPLHILDQSSGVEPRSTHESVMEQTPAYLVEPLTTMNLVKFTSLNIIQHIT